MRHLSVVFRLPALLLCAATSFTSQAQEADPPRLALAQGLGTSHADVATLTSPVGAERRVCWTNPNDTSAGAEDTNLVVNLRRYRVEGGAIETVASLPYQSWVPGASARSYCARTTLPRAGHWVFEAQLCRPDGACSSMVSAAVAQGLPGGAGSHAGQPRGWWLYAFLLAPGGIQVAHNQEN